jgi:hypothetical protein
LTASPATTSPVTPQLVDHVPFGYYAYPQ